MFPVSISLGSPIHWIIAYSKQIICFGPASLPRFQRPSCRLPFPISFKKGWLRRKVLLRASWKSSLTMPSWTQRHRDGRSRMGETSTGTLAFVFLLKRLCVCVNVCVCVFSFFFSFFLCMHVFAWKACVFPMNIMVPSNQGRASEHQENDIRNEFGQPATIIFLFLFTTGQAGHRHS